MLTAAVAQPAMASGGSDDLSSRLERAAATPAGRSRTAMLEGLAAEAEAAGRHQIAIEARRQLAADHCAAERWDLAFPELSLCLRRYDDHAASLGPGAGDGLRVWAGEMLPTLAEFPQVTLAHVEGAFADLTRRWGDDPAGLRPLAEARLRLGPITADWAAEEHYFERWQALGGARPGCAADIELMIERLVLRGDPQSVAQGLELAEPVLGGKVGLDRPLVGITCLMALPLARAGALHLARALGDTAARKLIQQDSRVEVAGRLAEFCALSGDLPTAVDLVEPRLWAFERLRRPYGLMEFATAAAVVGRQLIESGRPHYTLGQSWTPSAVTAEAFYLRATAIATDLAAQFDARNGNDHHSAQVQARLAATPLHVRARRELRLPANPTESAAAPQASAVAPDGDPGPAPRRPPGLARRPEPEAAPSRSRAPRWWRRRRSAPPGSDDA